MGLTSNYRRVQYNLAVREARLDAEYGTAEDLSRTRKNLVRLARSIHTDKLNWTCPHCGMRNRGVDRLCQKCDYDHGKPKHVDDNVDYRKLNRSEAEMVLHAKLHPKSDRKLSQDSKGRLVIHFGSEA